MTLPRCAKLDCEVFPRLVVKLVREDGTTEELAYACSLPHLDDVMYATRTLGARRRITGWALGATS